MYLGYLSMTYMLTWKFCPYLSANQRFSCCTLMLFKVQVVSPCIFLVEFTWRLMVWLSIFWMWVLYPLAVISRSTENQKCSQQLYSKYMYTMQMMHSNKNYFIKLLLHFFQASLFMFSLHFWPCKVLQTEIKKQERRECKRKNSLLHVCVYGGMGV